MSEPVFNQVSAIWIPVTNLERSVKWYSDVVGLRLVSNWGEGADFVIGGVIITLYVKPEKVPLGPIDEEIGIGYFGFSTNDIERTHALLSSRGVEVSPIKEYEMVSSFEFKDPDGNFLGVGYEKPNSPHHKP